MTPEVLVRAIAENGYAGVELAGPEHWARIADAGLAIIAERGHDSLANGLNRPENHDRIDREIHANLALAEKWRIPVLIYFSGNRSGLTDEAGAAQSAEVLRRVAPAAEDAGVTLVQGCSTARSTIPPTSATTPIGASTSAAGLTRRASNSSTTATTYR